MIGEGNYGCVMTPPSGDCKKSGDKNFVVKILAHKDDKEIQNLRRLQRTLKKDDFKYILIPISECKVKRSEVPSYMCQSTMGKIGDDSRRTLNAVVISRGVETLTTHIMRSGFVASIDKFFDVLRAIAILEKYKFTHGDIKPNNIMITKDNTAALIDFGLMKTDYEYFKSFQESKYCYWLYPPETIHLNKANRESGVDVMTDLYFFGIERFKPYLIPILNNLGITRGRINTIMKQTKISQDSWKKLDVYSLGIMMITMAHHTMEMDSLLKNKKMKSVLMKMIHPDPNKRSCASEILDEFQIASMSISASSDIVATDNPFD